MAKLINDVIDGGNDAVEPVPTPADAFVATPTPNPTPTPKPSPTPFTPHSPTGNPIPEDPWFTKIDPRYETAEGRATMTSDEKKDALRAISQNRLAQKAKERAAVDPAYDPFNRPAGPPNVGSYFFFWSWIGGINNGSWKLYRAPNDEEHIKKYGARRFGGPTQATDRTSVGVNALEVQPQLITGSDGKILGYAMPNSDGTIYGNNGEPVLGSDGKPLKVSNTGNAVGSSNNTDGLTFYKNDGPTSTTPSNISDTTKDAFAALEDLFRSYGLESLAEEI